MNRLYKKKFVLRNLFSEQNWYRLAIASLVIFSTCLRFWGLERFDTFVFDEVHFANFAHNYLTNTPVFDAHPPLGKYFISFGIWIFGFNPIGYRYINALLGSFIPVLAMAIAYQLTGKRQMTLLAGIFTAFDGLLLVESRYALLNTYLLLFGLLGNLFFLLTLHRRGWRQWIYLTFTGICFGAAIAVKWSGLNFTVAAYAIVLVLYFLQLCQKLFKKNFITLINQHIDFKVILPVEQINLPKLYQLACLPLVIYFIYVLAWQPHLKQNPGTIKEIEQQMYTFHKSYANRPEEHPYTSPWYTWPFMIRPVSYFYETTKSPNELVLSQKSVPINEASLVYDVHAMGNPLLYWLIVIAIFSLSFILLDLFRLLIKDLIWSLDNNVKKPIVTINFFVYLYLVLSYSANLFSWAGVSRFTFLYHYIPASAFGFLAVAWFVNELIENQPKFLKSVAIAITCAVIIVFLFFLPIYLGLPLSPKAFFLRMWLPTWV